LPLFYTDKESLFSNFYKNKKKMSDTEFNIDYNGYDADCPGRKHRSSAWNHGTVCLLLQKEVMISKTSLTASF